MKKDSNFNRRDFIRSLSFGTIGGAAMVNFSQILDKPEALKTKKEEDDPKLAQPNIILLVVDDQLISSQAFMPTLQSQLIDKGIIFENSFCTAPVCAPSRASIMTGQYIHNHGEITNNSRKFVKDRDSNDTIATVLKNGGYKNVYIGKYTHSYRKAKYVPPGWDEWYALLSGSPGYYNYKMSDNGRLVTYGDKPHDYSTDVLAQKAYGFIEGHKNSNQPFFMYLAPAAPHAPSIPAARHINKLSHLKFPYPLYEKDVLDKPKWVENYRTFNAGDKNRLKQEHLWKSGPRMLETLLAVDEMIDKIIQLLEDTGKLGNTFIFYLADNGSDQSRHIPDGAKLLPYEEGIRTPIIVRGPGVHTAIKRNHLVSTVDLLPTIASLAQVAVPKFTDGRSLIPLLECSPLTKDHWRKSCLVELGKFKRWYRKSPPPGYKILRTENFKYIEYGTGEKEFYDLRVDPHELLNIFNNLNPQQQNILHSQLFQLSTCSKNECQEAEDFDISMYIK